MTRAVNGHKGEAVIAGGVAVDRRLQVLVIGDRLVRVGRSVHCHQRHTAERSNGLRVASGGIGRGVEGDASGKHARLHDTLGTVIDQRRLRAIAAQAAASDDARSRVYGIAHLGFDASDNRNHLVLLCRICLVVAAPVRDRVLRRRDRRRDDDGVQRGIAREVIHQRCCGILIRRILVSQVGYYTARTGGRARRRRHQHLVGHAADGARLNRLRVRGDRQRG